MSHFSWRPKAHGTARRQPAAQAPKVLRVPGRSLLAAALLLAAGAIALVWLSHPERPALGESGVCPAGAPRRIYSVSLINIPLFLNRFGDVVPGGRMYVLDENIDVARATFTHAADPFNPKDIIEPLVLRANRGDCADIIFTNRLNEPPPAFERNDSIFTLPGEVLLPPGTVTPNPREFAPALTEPVIGFDPAAAPPASMHFTGLVYDVKNSDGTAAGFNPSSVVLPGQTIVYHLYADQEGEFPFQDGADLSSSAAGAGRFVGSNAFGAFGAFAVEPPGSSWLDVNTGQPLRSGTRAMIVDPNGPDFREHALFMHDEIEPVAGILTRLCAPPGPVEPGGEPPAPESGCVDPTPEQLAKLQAGTLPVFGGGDADALINDEVAVKLEWFGFNYRSEPGFNRKEVGCPPLEEPFQAAACLGDGVGFSSWAFGDPGGGDLVLHNYRGEPTVVRLFQGAEKETHTFHWHVVRWPFDPDDEGGLANIARPGFHTEVTNPIDVQAVSPGSHYTLIFEGGAGSPHDGKPAAFGDIIFHCHLYPHLVDGMWGLNRSHDVLEDGTRQLPDTTPILPLVPLPDFLAPPEPTAEEPGFPFFMPGVFGHKPPKPPLGVPERQADGVFPPTPLEMSAAEPDAQVSGAFFVNPCPATRDDGQPTPLKVFEVALIEIDALYSDDLGWHDPQHRQYVLQEHKQDVLSGARPPEPFSPLLNVGDCVEYRLTNELPLQFGGTVFDRPEITAEASIHQHQVQFDPLSSDGASNGWNYDEAADVGQTIVYRDFVSADVRTNSFHDHMFAALHQDSGLFGGSTVHPPGCTFHDPETGEPVTVGTIVDIRCTPALDYHGRPTDGESYRSYALFIEDHVPMFQPEDPNDPADDPFVTPEGVPIFPPPFPSSHDDNGVMGVNYRLEPFEARRGSDPANLFSSRVWGDPYTPLLRAYAGDRVKFHLLQISFEESHGFNLHRWRWKLEPDDPESNIAQAQHIGMLEYFELDVRIDREDPNPDGLDLRDYLYFYGGAEDWFLGAWGIFRVAGCDFNATPVAPTLGGPLQPLPDNQPHECVGLGSLPELPRAPGNPCPTDAGGGIIAPLRRYTVVAINKDIVYNNSGVHDPNGLMYVLEEDLEAVLNGAKEPEPLAIRANVGECIEVTLRNELDPAKMQPHCFEALEAGQLGFQDPALGNLTMPECLNPAPEAENEVPGFEPFPVSARVSINPKLVDYDIGSDGANVGYNVDSTVGPGESILYRWYAAEEVGLAVLHDRADVQNHLHHGLYGALIVEPAGSSYLNPTDGSPLLSGQDAVIVDPNGPDFREHVVLMNSDLSLFQAGGLPVPDNLDLALVPSHLEHDPEDQGEFSINYRNEPWAHRFQSNSDLSQVFSSIVHGDPATPVFRAYAGDNVRFRVAQAVGDPRSTGFALHGHRWRRSPNDPQSQIAATQGQFNPTVTYNIHLDPEVFGGAGGPNGFPGDYLYRSTNLARHLPGGQWGIFRVLGTLQDDLIQLPDRAAPGLGTGLLRVTASPSVPSQILIDGIPRDTWGLDWLSLAPGDYEVSFSDVEGWSKPEPQMMTVNPGAPTALAAAFSQRGFLQVVTSSPVPGTILVDGIPRDDWGMFTDLAPATHEVCFGEVEGFAAPPCQSATVTAGSLVMVTGAYTPDPLGPAPSGFGMLRVITSPAVPSQIVIDGVPRDTWGLEWLKLAPGAYEVSFADVGGFTTPEPQTVTVTEGATTEVTGVFSQRGTLRVRTSPAVAGTIVVNGVPRNDWGMWTDLAPATYEVCFGEVEAFAAPPCRFAAVNAGSLTEVTGVYAP